MDWADSMMRWLKRKLLGEGSDASRTSVEQGGAQAQTESGAAHAQTVSQTAGDGDVNYTIYNVNTLNVYYTWEEPKDSGEGGG